MVKKLVRKKTEPVLKAPIFPKPEIIEKTRDPRGRKKGCAKTGGRQKGSGNKVPKLLKEAIIEAATQVGNTIPDINGEPSMGGMIAYLQFQAIRNPTPFLALLGKIIPMQVTGEDGGPIETHYTVEFVDATSASK